MTHINQKQIHTDTQTQNLVNELEDDCSILSNAQKYAVALTTLKEYFTTYSNLNQLEHDYPYKNKLLDNSGLSCLDGLH